MYASYPDFAEDLRREGRAAAAAALEDDRAVAVDLLGLRGQLLERDVAGAVDTAGLPLVVLADVDQLCAGGDLLARLSGARVQLDVGRLRSSRWGRE